VSSTRTGIHKRTRCRTNLAGASSPSNARRKRSTEEDSFEYQQQNRKIHRSCYFLPRGENKPHTTQTQAPTLHQCAPWDDTMPFMNTATILRRHEASDKLSTGEGTRRRSSRLTAHSSSSQATRIELAVICARGGGMRGRAAAARRAAHLRRVKLLLCELLGGSAQVVHAHMGGGDGSKILVLHQKMCVPAFKSRRPKQVV